MIGSEKINKQTFKTLLLFGNDLTMPDLEGKFHPNPDISIFTTVVSRMKFRKKPVPRLRDFLVINGNKNGIQQPF